MSIFILLLRVCLLRVLLTGAIESHRRVLRVLLLALFRLLAILVDLFRGKIFDLDLSVIRLETRLFVVGDELAPLVLHLLRIGQLLGRQLLQLHLGIFLKDQGVYRLMGIEEVNNGAVGDASPLLFDPRLIDLLGSRRLALRDVVVVHLQVGHGLRRLF